MPGRLIPHLIISGLCAVAVACGGVEPATINADRFSATGELIAWSGGEAGPKNACHVCHGLYGEGNGAGVPRLAGLPSGYLAKQLLDYADGRRQHTAMHTIAVKLSPAEHRAVADWYASRPAPRAPVRGEADPLGRALYHRGAPERGLQPCAACHGAQGQGVGAGNPPLWGQPAAYQAEQLRLWRSGKRQNSGGHVMLTVSRALTEQESLAVSRYAATLPGSEALASAPAPASSPRPAVVSAEAPGRAPSPPTRRPDPRNGA